MNNILTFWPTIAQLSQQSILVNSTIHLGHEQLLLNKATVVLRDPLIGKVLRENNCAAFEMNNVSELGSAPHEKSAKWISFQLAIVNFVQKNIISYSSFFCYI